MRMRPLGHLRGQCQETSIALVEGAILKLMRQEEYSCISGSMKFRDSGKPLTSQPFDIYI